MLLDTETTGLPKRRGAHYWDLDMWPRMVSTCWAFYTAEGQEAHFRHYIIRPDGFTIPDDATLIHGISTERALKEGVPLAPVLRALANDISMGQPALAVGHNVAFDWPVLLAEYLRCGLQSPLKSLPNNCTMVNTTELCCLPPLRGGKHKWPKLTELHYHLFGMDYGASHHAGGDVRACGYCVFELQPMGIAPFPLRGQGLRFSEAVTCVAEREPATALMSSSGTSRFPFWG